MRLVQSIGFNRQVRREWLDEVAAHLLNGANPKQSEVQMLEVLTPIMSGEGAANRGSRQKTMTILKKIWLAPPRELTASRDEALELMRTHERSEWLVFHWMMTAGAYPFFADVAQTVGRLLRVQQNFGAADLAARMMEKYGEKEGVRRSTRYVLRAMVEWGVLKDEKLGTYAAMAKQTCKAHDVLGWIVRTRIRSNDSGGAYLSTMVQDPALFPFSLEALRDTISSLPGIQASAQGADQLLRLND